MMKLSYLLERSLCEQVTFDPGQGLVRIVVRLLYQPELLALRLVQSALDAVRLLQPLQGQDQQVRVVFVGQGREGDRGESAALQPVYGRRVDSDGFLCCDVWAVLCDINNTTVNSASHDKSLGIHWLITPGL